MTSTGREHGPRRTSCSVMNGTLGVVKAAESWRDLPYDSWSLTHSQKAAFAVRAIHTTGQ